MVEFAKKTLYCLQMMRLVEWLADTACGHFQKRILARSFFVYLDAFIKLFRPLRNQVAASGADAAKIADLKELTKKLDSDYEGFYAKIRDKIGAHRQQMDLGELVEAWNEIEQPVVAILMEDALVLYKGLAPLHQDVPSYAESGDIVNPLLKRDARQFGRECDASGIVVSGDALGVTRENAVSLIPGGVLQRKIADILHGHSLQGFDAIENKLSKRYD